LADVEDRRKSTEKRDVGTLESQERTVLSLYYFEELKLHEIATILGVTGSRTSQVRTKALGRLRAMLASLRSSA
jgi:RNA polymerase sigma factor FliA